MDCAQACKDARVLWNPKVQALKPLQGAMWVSHHVIHSSYLHKPAQIQQPLCYCLLSWYISQSAKSQPG